MDGATPRRAAEKGGDPASAATANAATIARARSGASADQRRALERSGALTSAELRRGLAVLATVGASAPFVGLLGTVFGVINSFQGMAASGESGLNAVAGGIAEALFMTGVGLAVAIPAVWAYNYLSNRIEYLEKEMSNSASELLDYLLDRTEPEMEKATA